MSNSIEKLAKEAERLAENLQGNPFPAFDRIAKDIRERQDNAIAMEFTKCIGELLRKNGVVPKLTEYTRNFETDKTFETRYGVSIDELDFSEHDKVFEDEVADLKQRIRELIKEKDEYKRKCNAFGFENQELKQITKGYEDKIAELENIINHKLGNWDKHGITYQKIMDMKAENDLLKQRIVELESENEKLFDYLNGITGNTKEEIRNNIDNIGKINKKPTKINLNDRIKVKLTPLGAEIYYHQYDDVNKKIKKNGGTELEPIMPQINKDGYTEFQLWHFMELYGKHIGMCKPNVIEPLDIVIVE